MALAEAVVYVGSLMGPAGTDAANAKFTELERAKWLKGELPNGTNTNTFKIPGLWIIRSVAHAETMTGLAENYPSLFLVEGDPVGSTIIFRQKQIIHGSGRVYARMSSEGSSTYLPWSDTGADFGDAPAGYDFNTLGEGRIAVKAPNHTTMLNAPSGAGPGLVVGFVSRTFAIFKAQIYFEYGGSGGQGGKIWARTSNSFTTLGAWKDLTATSSGGGGGGSELDYSVENPFANDQRKQWFIRRRGGFIGTGGKATVAIRIDHGAVNMRDLVLAELVRLSLPWGMAINPAQTRLDLPENAGVTWADYNEWARVKGMEPWNHGYSHVQALETSELMQQIVGGRDLLQENMPASAIEGWMVPGVGANGYGGQSSTNAVDSYFGYEAGRIILSSHAVASGYGGGALRPQLGALVDGQAHLGLDSAVTSSEIIAQIQEAQDIGGAIQLFLHPSQIGLADKTTVTVLNEIWEFLAAERDAGRLIMLSPSGLLLADPAKSTRANLVRFADFKTKNGRTWTNAWQNTTGWSANADGVTTSTGGLLTQTIPETTIKHCRGALFEIVAEVSSTDGVTVQVGSSTLAGALKSVTLTAGQTRTIRQHVTLPLNSSAAFNVTVGRVSGGALTVKNMALQPV